MVLCARSLGSQVKLAFLFQSFQKRAEKFKSALVLSHKQALTKESLVAAANNVARVEQTNRRTNGHTNLHTHTGFEMFLVRFALFVSARLGADENICSSLGDSRGFSFAANGRRATEFRRRMK